MSNIDKYRDDLDSMIQLGQKMERDLLFRCRKDLGTLEKGDEDRVKEIELCFERNYQRWYTESCAVIKQLIPDRFSEFEHLYKGDGRRQNLDLLTYTIQDWLNGTRAVADFSGKKPFDDLACVTNRLGVQLDILESTQLRFESTLFDIKQLTQADLFDSELDVARELLNKKFVRSAGAIAGVVLEKHLAQVIANHSITTRKRNPTISDFNELLKQGKALDIPSWRQIQRLADIRNLCVHNKQREPTFEETEELISGAEKYIKTLF